MLIDVTEIHPPKIGGKVCKIVAADGEHYQIWPEKLTGVDVGKRYEAEITERDYNGRTFKSIKSIVPAPMPVPESQSTPVQKNCDASGEAEYVGRVLAALITKGQVVERSQIAAATEWLRKVWRQI